MQSLRRVAVLSYRKNVLKCLPTNAVLRGSVRALSWKKKEEDVIYEEATSKFNRKDEEDLEKRSMDSNKKGFLESIADKALKFIGMDEESRERRENKRKVNREIDNALRGTGLVGGLIGSLMKSVTGTMMDQISQQNKDTEKLRDHAMRIAMRDNDVVQMLGNNIECGGPFSQGTHMVQVNNRMRKKMHVGFVLEGSRSEGELDVEAVVIDDEMKIKSVMFRVSGYQKELKVDDKPDVIIDV